MAAEGTAFRTFTLNQEAIKQPGPAQSKVIHTYETTTVEDTQRNPIQLEGTEGLNNKNTEKNTFHEKNKQTKENQEWLSR